MDLPTYTNIWRIEKRLYKLYDFRLPMPLPVGQIAVFAAIAVPYLLALTLIGIPFTHTLLWVYVLPPGVLTWLATRPVLESKRLPELLGSQLRYLSEPRTWCRMAPLAEKDEITVSCRVWRRAGQDEPAAAEETAGQAHEAGRAQTAVPVPGSAGPHAAGRGAAPQPARRARAAGRAPAPAAAMIREPAAAEATQPAAAEAPQPAAAQVPQPAAAKTPGGAVGAAAMPQAIPARERAPRSPAAAAAHPAVAVTATGNPDSRPRRVVERALSDPSGRRAEGWRDQVVVVPGGHRPGRPDQQQRDRTRARLALGGPRRIVVLGCTVGAGQTVTAWMAGEMLAILRDDPVAVLDLNPGPGSLAERAAAAAVLPGGPPPASGTGRPALAASRLEVITRAAPDADADSGEDDPASLLSLLSGRYPLTLADPAARAVPRILAVANQLVLVVPASSEAASALAMTLEWLEVHGHRTLAAEAVTVINGVSRTTMEHAEQAEAVASGRCRAIVRVPWDDQLTGPEPECRPAGAGPHPHRPGGTPIGLAAVHAYTALAGVLVAGLADLPELRSARL